MIQPRCSPVRLVAALCLAAAPVLLAQSHDNSAQWPTYGGDPGGMRYTASNQITRDNVSKLVPVWTFHTGSVAKGRPGVENSSFEATPILFNGVLYLTSPYDEIFAVDPITGARKWVFDPQLTRNLTSGLLTSRGVAAWGGAGGSPCSGRIFVATMDARLLAIDAATGARCADFGSGGEVDLAKGVLVERKDLYFSTSPPTVVGNLLIVGSAIADNQRVDIESGVVRAFDCVTGKLVWSWDPIPWASQQKLRTGAANAWSVIAADPEHGLVYVPTGAPSPDFYGGKRPGDNRDANSVVALEAATGKRVWGFQVVHHDLWDYDVAAEPLLFTFRGRIPAIAITTKQGLLFVLNRLTGEPLYPVTERPVPASDVDGEQASPTQPFQDIATLAPNSFPANAQFGGSAEDDADCRKLMSKLRYDGIYTPPSLRGTLAYPGNLGGVNWGSAAFDPASGILYANTNRYAFSLTLSPRKGRLAEALAFAEVHIDQLSWIGAAAVTVLLLLVSMFRRRRVYPGGGALVASVAVIASTVALVAYVDHREAERAKGMPVVRKVEHFGTEFGPQLGTPYTILREQLIAPRSRLPCTVAPWGTVSAINLNTGKAAWETPLGTRIAGRQTGTVNLGGDIVTASGLLFTAASEEPYLRAFDSANGRELWKGALPVPAQSTPMSYTLNGRQYVVIAAGGHGLFGTPVSDALVAFALPQ